MGVRKAALSRVIDRAQKTVVGQFHCGQRYNYVKAFDQRIPFEIVIPRGEEWPGGGADSDSGSRGAWVGEV